MYNNLILFVFNLILFWLAWLECKYTKILKHHFKHLYIDTLTGLIVWRKILRSIPDLKLIWLSYTQSQNSLH